MAKRKEELEVEAVEPVAEAPEVVTEPEPIAAQISDKDWFTQATAQHRYKVASLPEGGYVVRPDSFTGEDFVIQSLDELATR